MSGLISKLTAMGCNFALPNSEAIPDPEKVIIDALDYFWSDKKIFTMMIGLLCHRIHQLINTQRLIFLASDLEKNKKILLIVVCNKVVRATGDQRFQLVASRLSQSKMKLTNCPSIYKDAFYLKRLGLDIDFKKFDVYVPKFFEPQHIKKYKSIEMIYSENLWLRLRALAGTDYRADMIYLKSAGLVKNQVEAARIIGCNKSSISRIWNSIQGFDELVKMV